MTGKHYLKTCTHSMVRSCQIRRICRVSLIWSDGGLKFKSSLRLPSWLRLWSEGLQSRCGLRLKRAQSRCPQIPRCFQLDPPVLPEPSHRFGSWRLFKWPWRLLSSLNITALSITAAISSYLKPQSCLSPWGLHSTPTPEPTPPTITTTSWPHIGTTHRSFT